MVTLLSRDSGRERHAFSWVGRREALRLLRAPCDARLLPSKKESDGFDGARHIFIEGDNLDALKLLSREYSDSVKMIYIDPPYNTRGDFVYADNYATRLRDYLRAAGRKGNAAGAAGPTETSGRFHAAWLTMMYPRLALARRLLRDDGVIFVSIDDHEMHHLRLLMDEIFGEECFKNCIVFRRGAKNVQAQFGASDALAVGHEYILMYARNARTRFRMFRVPLDAARGGSWNNHWRGTNRPTMRYELFDVTPVTGQWRWQRARSLRAIENHDRMLRECAATRRPVAQSDVDAWYASEKERAGVGPDLLRLSAKGKPEHYVSAAASKLGSDLWTDISPRGSAELKKLFGGKVFDNPKPVALIRRMLEFATEPRGGDIILDFFAGSGTTAQAVLERNRDDGGDRRCILVQRAEALPRPICLEDTELLTIADIGKERIRRVIAAMKKQDAGRSKKKHRKSPETPGFKVFVVARNKTRPDS